jgi:hypothetical protein
MVMGADGSYSSNASLPNVLPLVTQLGRQQQQLELEQSAMQATKAAAAAFDKAATEPSSSQQLKRAGIDLRRSLRGSAAAAAATKAASASVSSSGRPHLRLQQRIGSESFDPSVVPEGTGLSVPPAPPPLPSMSDMSTSDRGGEAGPASSPVDLAPLLFRAQTSASVHSALSSVSSVAGPLTMDSPIFVAKRVTSDKVLKLPTLNEVAEVSTPAATASAGTPTSHFLFRDGARFAQQQPQVRSSIKPILPLHSNLPNSSAFPTSYMSASDPNSLLMQASLFLQQQRESTEAKSSSTPSMYVGGTISPSSMGPFTALVSEAAGPNSAHILNPLQPWNWALITALSDAVQKKREKELAELHPLLVSSGSSGKLNQRNSGAPTDLRRQKLPSALSDREDDFDHDQDTDSSVPFSYDVDEQVHATDTSASNTATMLSLDAEAAEVTRRASAAVWEAEMNAARKTARLREPAERRAKLSHHATAAAVASSFVAMDSPYPAQSGLDSEMMFG